MKPSKEKERWPSCIFCHNALWEINYSLSGTRKAIFFCNIFLRPLLTALCLLGLKILECFFSKFLAVLLMFFCAKNYRKMCQSSYFPREDWKFLEITITSYSNDTENSHTVAIFCLLIIVHHQLKGSLSQCLISLVKWFILVWRPVIQVLFQVWRPVIQGLFLDFFRTFYQYSRSLFPQAWYTVSHFFHSHSSKG